jgi:hypothetical protein
VSIYMGVWVGAMGVNVLLPGWENNLVLKKIIKY